MSRKNLLSSLHGDGKQTTPAAPAPHGRPFMDASKSKPMAAVTKTLGDLNDRNKRASEIEKRLAEGQTVVELDVSQIDPSFLQDRMEGDVDGLRASIKEQGQQVPILVRPHRETPGRYQVAFGHRRLRALKELGLQAKAIVRDLTDEQLVVAQGQENNERQDLTFIEKARFATRLRERFSREVITASMSIDKGNLSKMFTIIETIPAALIDAIGPAPGVGQPNWQRMADFMQEAPNVNDFTDYARSKAIQDMTSADRFKAVLALRSKASTKALPTVLATSVGARIAQMTESKVGMEIKIDKRATPEFAEFVRNNLVKLFEEHQAKQKLETGE